MVRLGHKVKLIAPQYVKPFVKRQKNDAADAQAIVTAAQRPDMRFVDQKTAEQQASAVLFRVRERLVHQRTELINALRAILYEFGHVFPQGAIGLKRIGHAIKTGQCDLPALVVEECQGLLTQIADKTERIEAKTKAVKALSRQSEMARRVQTMPGVGPLTGLAIEVFAPAMNTFRRGRDFAAWLGLVPRQFSSGGKARLGRISKAGQSDIRRLLIMGAMSRLARRSQWLLPEGSWLAQMLTRKPKMLVAIALANKTARQLWAMMTKKQDYQLPAQGHA